MADKTIKALECCIRDDGCEQCSILEECFLFYDKPYAETPKILILSLDLINRQQAEIEKLTEETMNMAITIETCKAEAIKEFAERLKDRTVKVYVEWDWRKAVTTEVIENLVKEMVGENE